MEIAEIDKGGYIPSIEKMRIFLMICAMLYTYQLHPILGKINGALFSFAFPALFIISGYIILYESDDIEQRIIRTIKRTAICFLILFAVYLGLSLLVDMKFTVATIKLKSFWVDFLVFNIWSLPVGSVIWYVQALLYAYVIIFIVYKLNLLRFDIYIALILLAVTLLTGEFSAVIGFEFLGHSYIPGNFLTRALPYILIGSFISRKEELFINFDLGHFIGIAVSGIVLAAAEYAILTVTGKMVYSNHLLGMGFVAVAICLFTFGMDEMELQSDALLALSRFERTIPFFVSSPVCIVLSLLFTKIPEIGYYIGGFIGIITVALSVLILYLYSFSRIGLMMLFNRDIPEEDL